MESHRSQPQPSGQSARVAIGAHLRAVSLFEDIRANDAAIEELAACLETRDFAAGETIIQEGTAGAEFFVLIEGDASVYKTTGDGDPYKVALLHGSQHAFFGEGALLDSEARSATIRAESACRCLVLSRAAFEDFSARRPQWALPALRRIARVVMARLRRSGNDFMLLYNALLAEVRGR